MIKSGIELQSVGKVFITGILPITIDDLISGFNIAEIVTLEERLVNMLGFTHEETENYLAQVFDSCGFDMARKPGILSIMKNHYDGYRFLPEAEETLYNSTIVTYFLKRFALNDGKIPRELIDDNLKTDVSWIERLTTVNENFVRCTFYELCVRYHSRDFTFSMEVNYPSGRSDWEMTGKYHTKYKDTKTIIEFKYVPAKDADKVLSLQAPLETDAAKVTGYKNDVLQMFPHFAVETYVAGNKGFRLFRGSKKL